MVLEGCGKVLEFTVSNIMETLFELFLPHNLYLFTRARCRRWWWKMKPQHLRLSRRWLAANRWNISSSRCLTWIWNISSKERKSILPTLMALCTSNSARRWFHWANISLGYFCILCFSGCLYHIGLKPRAGSGVVRIDLLRFLAGCRTRRLNQV